MKGDGDDVSIYVPSMHLILEYHIGLRHRTPVRIRDPRTIHDTLYPVLTNKYRGIASISVSSRLSRKVSRWKPCERVCLTDDVTRIFTCLKPTFSAQRW